MSQQELHLVKVGHKALENNLTRIQWPQLTDKQTKRVQEAISGDVSIRHQGDGAGAQHRGSVCASHPAALGSNLSRKTVFKDRTHQVLTEARDFGNALKDKGLSQTPQKQCQTLGSFCFISIAKATLLIWCSYYLNYP